MANNPKKYWHQKTSISIGVKILFVFMILSTMSHPFFSRLYDIKIEPQISLLEVKRSSFINQGVAIWGSDPVGSEYEIRRDQYSVTFERDLNIMLPEFNIKAKAIDGRDIEVKTTIITAPACVMVNDYQSKEDQFIGTSMILWKECLSGFGFKTIPNQKHMFKLMISDHLLSYFQEETISLSLSWNGFTMGIFDENGRNDIRPSK